jgi:hypothetical protein
MTYMSAAEAPATMDSDMALPSSSFFIGLPLGTGEFFIGRREPLVALTAF